MKKALLLVALLVGFSAGAQTQAPPQEQAVELIRELRKIHSPNGIEVLEQLTLNGEKQWVSIRGKNTANPVLLFIHGGPASPVMPISWAFQDGWEDYFTVVQWDQRVSGKNWLTADTAQAASQLSMEQIVNDGAELIDHLCRRLSKEKVFILGYSFGSMVGIRLAQRLPEKIHAYIGMGQVADGDPEKYLYTRLLELATEDHNQTALKELKALAPYPRVGEPTPMRDLLVARKWARHYNGGWYGKTDFKLLFSLPELSPDYSPEEIAVLDKSTSWSSRKIMGSGRNRVFPLEFQMPVVFMMGRHDLHTPYQPAQAYFDQIKAPQKKFITFEYSAHVPMLEEPGRFLVALVNEVLPLAGGEKK